MVMHESYSHADLFANKSVDDFVRLDVDLLQNKLELRNLVILLDCDGIGKDRLLDKFLGFSSFLEMKNIK